MSDNQRQIDTKGARAGPKSDGTHDITHFNRSKDSADFAQTVARCPLPLAHMIQDYKCPLLRVAGLNRSPKSPCVRVN